MGLSFVLRVLAAQGPDGPGRDVAELVEIAAPETAPEPPRSASPDSSAPPPSAETTSMRASAEPPASAEATSPTATRRRFAVGVFGGLSFGLYPVPSGDAGVFLGGTLRSGRTALGYRGELSIGEAEFAPGYVVHRHHFAFLGLFGARRRMLFGADLGFKVAGPRGLGLEAAVQLGGVIASGSRGSLVVGGVVRYGGWLCGPCGHGGYPTFGVNIGWLGASLRATPSAPTATREPPAARREDLDEAIAAPLAVRTRLRVFTLDTTTADGSVWLAFAPLDVAFQVEPRRGTWGGVQVETLLPDGLPAFVTGHLGRAWPRIGVAAVLGLGAGYYEFLRLGIRFRGGSLARTHVRGNLVWSVFYPLPFPAAAELGVYGRLPTRRPLWLALDLDFTNTIFVATGGLRFAVPSRTSVAAHFVQAAAGVAASTGATPGPSFLLSYEYRWRRG